MPTVREVLTARAQRLQDRRTLLLAEVTAINAQLNALQNEVQGLAGADETKLARLQALGVIQATD